jgi:hypothetical protein
VQQNIRLTTSSTGTWHTSTTPRDTLSSGSGDLLLRGRFSFVKSTPLQEFLVLLLRAGLMNTLAAGDSYRDLVWWWRVPVGFTAQKRGSRPITAGAVHAHWLRRAHASEPRSARSAFLSLSYWMSPASRYLL